MLNVPTEVQALFKADSVFKNFRVHFPNGENADLTNDDIVSESVSFTESICSAQVFQFGLSERSEIEFECVGVQNIYGMTIECAIEIEVASLGAEWLFQQWQEVHAREEAGTWKWLDCQVVSPYQGHIMYRVPYGRFIVESCPRSQGAMKHRRVDAFSVVGGQKVELSPFLKFKFNAPLYQNEKSMIQNVPLLLACNKNDISDITVTETELETNSTASSYDVVRPISWYDGDTLHTISFRRSGAMTYFGQIKNWMFDTMLRSDRDSLFRVVCDVDYSTITPVLDRLNELNAPTDVINIVRSVLTVFYYADSDTRYGNKVVYAFENAEDTGYLYAFANETGSYGICFKNSGCDRAVIDLGTTSSESFNIGETVSNLHAYQYTLTDPDMLNQTIEVTATGAYGYLSTYTDALDFASLVDGYTEIHGQFRRPSRNGDAEYVTVSKSEPVAMTPAEYSELWWDEFDVEPVGTITATYKDVDAGQEQIVTYDVGTGQSTYTMNDNYFLKSLNLSAADLTGQTLEEYVKALLDENFVPKLQDVSFVPVTLDAIGLPYIEAGDYLEIDDADGGTVGTYVLSRTLSGIQVLTDSIESKGGEVLGNGS